MKKKVDGFQEHYIPVEYSTNIFNSQETNKRRQNEVVFLN